jgi:hypothetical protein
LNPVPRDLERLWRGGVGDLDNLCSEGIGTEFSTPLNHAAKFGVMPLPPPHGASIRHARNSANDIHRKAVAQQLEDCVRELGAI